MSVERVFSFNIMIPANTTPDDPLLTELTIPDGPGVSWTINTPGNGIGFGGIALMLGGAQLVPENVGGYITGNYLGIDGKLDGVPPSGGWSALAYNISAAIQLWNVVFRIGRFAIPKRSDDDDGPPPAGLIRTGLITPAYA